MALRRWRFPPGHSEQQRHPGTSFFCVTRFRVGSPDAQRRAALARASTQISGPRDRRDDTRGDRRDAARRLIGAIGRTLVRKKRASRSGRCCSVGQAGDLHLRGAPHQLRRVMVAAMLAVPAAGICRMPMTRAFLISTASRTAAGRALQRLLTESLERAGSGRLRSSPTPTRPTTTME